jgi:glycosyltransferase involved in cell wall biosynthesis
LSKSLATVRILVLTSTFPRWRGDTEPPFVLELCRRLAEHFKVHILAPHTGGADSEATFDGMRVTRYRYFLPRWESLAYKGGILANLKKNRYRYALIPFFLLFQTLAVRKLLRRFHFDLIHAHWIIPQGACAVLANRIHLSRLPILCTSHGGDLYGLSSRAMMWLRCRILEKIDAITTVSRAMRDDLDSLGVGLGKVHVLPMGVNLQERFVPSRKRSETKSLLFVGRVVEKKGLRFLIEAMPKIIEKHPTTVLRVAGDGQELSDIKSLAKNIGVADHIHFLGAVPNRTLPELYQTSDVMVFPSVVADGGDKEGFGLVLVEALGCECAVVATDLPATRDIIHDGVSALIVRQRDARQIADKVIHLLSDPALRANLGKKGRQYVVKRFDWAAITTRYANLIQSTIGYEPVCKHTVQ